MPVTVKQSSNRLAVNQVALKTPSTSPIAAATFFLNHSFAFKRHSKGCVRTHVLCYVWETRSSQFDHVQGFLAKYKNRSLRGKKAILPGSSALLNWFKLPTGSFPSTCRSIGFKKALLYRTRPDLQTYRSHHHLISQPPALLHGNTGRRAVTYSYFWKTVKAGQRKLFVLILMQLDLSVFISGRWL